MTVFNRKFGVEIEYTGMPRGTLRSVLTENGYDVHPRERGSLSQWSVVYDGSVSDPDNGGELVSPVLSGPEGIETIGKVARLMSRNGAKADRTCGLHVHVDANDLTPAEIKTISRRYARFESEIDAFMPRSRRGNGNNYCYSMSSDILDEIERCLHKEHFCDIERYYKVNVNAFYKHGTIEFRQHSGSINAEKIKNWVKFCVSFIEESRTIHKEMMDAFNRTQIENNLIRLQQAAATPEVPQISIMNNPNRPVDYPLSPVSETDTENVRIVNRESLRDSHFRYLGYSEQAGLSYSTIRYVIRYLIHGVDLETQRVYTFSTGTVRRAMSALRQVGYRINHRRGTGHYILDSEQPRSIFDSNVVDILFNLNTRSSNNNNNRYEQRNRISEPTAKYDVSLNDTLFRGIDEEVVAFYQERATEFQETLATGRRNPR